MRNYPERGHRLGQAMHLVVRCRRKPPDAEPSIGSEEITDIGWSHSSALPRPISDFTIRRINDAMETGPLLTKLINERIWYDE